MAADSDPKSEYVTVFDSSKPLASSSDLVIPPIPNSDFWTTNRMKNLIPHPDSDEHGINSEAPSGSISYGLTARDRQLAALRRFEEDMKKLPEHRGMEEYNEVPVEKFAAALLAPYGWKEGMGIGKRNFVDTKEVQCDLSMLEI